MRNESRAVVIGGSMAGLVAARVLAERVGQVSIIDRDTLPLTAVNRTAVPQGRHAHGLLAAGERILRDLFPGLMEELVEGGAQAVTMDDARWWQMNGYRTHAPGAPDGTLFSRPLLEAVVRQRVAQLPNVSFHRAAAAGLEYRDARVIGVHVVGDDGAAIVPADLAVDCSGRGSRAARWLTDIGYPEPAVARVQVDVRYASRLYRRTPGLRADHSWYVTIGDPACSKRVGVAFPIEGDRWIVTLAGSHGDHPPTDDEGYLAWARTLPTGDIADLIRDEEPLGQIVTHRLPSSQWRHFEKLPSHPTGFVALGDSVCSFNPIYGQGMSSAAQQAVALGRAIDRHEIDGAGIPRAFYRAAAKIIANPWAIAAGADFAFPETTGPKPPMTDVINRYVAKAIVAAQHDGVVATAMWEVQNLLSPPQSLMRPTVVARVVRAARRGPAIEHLAAPTAASLPTPSRAS